MFNLINKRLQFMTLHQESLQSVVRVIDKHGHVKTHSPMKLLEMDAPITFGTCTTMYYTELMVNKIGVIVEGIPRTFNGLALQTMRMVLFLLHFLFLMQSLLMNLKV